MAEKTDEPCTRDPGSMLVLLPTFLPRSQTSLYPLPPSLTVCSSCSREHLSLKTSCPNRHCHFPRLWQINGPLRNSVSLHLCCSESIWKLFLPKYPRQICFYLPDPAPLSILNLYPNWIFWVNSVFRMLAFLGNISNNIIWFHFVKKCQVICSLLKIVSFDRHEVKAS